MYNREFTPDRITMLKPNEIFVFGSNLAGAHGGGAARLAFSRFGAVWGQGIGLQGQSYAIPTMQGGVETIKPYVDEFIAFARQHPERKFLVTRIGCGIAAFTPKEIAPLFQAAIDQGNIILPRDFVELLAHSQNNSPASSITENTGKDDQVNDHTQSTAEQTEALQMWTMGAGNSAKRFNGENPIPPKTKVAIKSSWKVMPMPDKNTVIPLNVTLPSDVMRIIKYGHIPEAMEDHWFMYCDEDTIHYHRSWTGICIFEAEYEEYGGGYRITHLKVNRDPEQYGSTDIRKDANLFLTLLTEEYGGDATAFWNKFLGSFNAQTEDQTTGQESLQSINDKNENLMDIQKDRIRGSLIGGAIGDALGYPVEFVSTFKAIQHQYGQRGITRLDTRQHRQPADGQTGKAVISDDTQMTLFTANGLLNARRLGMPDITGISNAYIEWYFTQTGGKTCPYHDCWIARIPELNARRAPGNTCMTALDSILKMRKPGNNSKGCGGVMRVAPIPLYAAVEGRMGIEDADRLAGDAAELTHKHPLGFIPAALMAHIIYRLACDTHPTQESLKGHIMEGVEVIRKLYKDSHNDVERMAELAERAILQLDNGKTDLDNIGLLGEGWVGEEALAIALFCALKHFDNFEDALIAAVNHGGDSDSTGAITGNILGAAIGYEAIPGFFLDDLELHDVILHMADDIFLGTITK